MTVLNLAKLPITTIDLSPGSHLLINDDWEDFGSTAFKKPQKVGLEPDTCFYIQNAGRVRSFVRLNLETDPPPDLAIEADVISRTTLEAYAALPVPEVWIYDQSQLAIHRLQDNGYRSTATSLIFPDLPITTWIPQLVADAFAKGTRTMLRGFRQQLQES